MFLFAAFAGIALASCTTDEEIFAPVNQGNEIEFVAADYVHQTRAEHDTTLTFSNADYSVWAWENDTDYPHMNGVKVTYANGVNTVTGTYYWPDEALDFAAISPAADKRIAVDRTGGATTVTYTFDNVDGYRNDQTNLMHADFVESQTKATANVSLGFRHALAKLNVVVNQTQNADNGNPTGVAGYQVNVNKLFIEDFDCYGTYTVTSNDQNKTDRTWTSTSHKDADWSIISDSTSLVVDTVNFADQTFKATYERTGFVMPQALSDDVKVTIDYDIVTKFKSGATSTINKKDTVQLNTIENGSRVAIKNWYTNKVITYTFTINPKHDLTPITFSAKEEVWGTQDGAHTF